MKWWMMPVRWKIGLLLIFIVGVGIRCPFPRADPPVDLSWSGGYFADEGFWAHDARSKVLFGEFGDDQWHDRFVSPWTFYIIKLLFIVFGAGLAPLRLWAQFISAAALLVWLFILKDNKRSSSLFAFIFMGVNILLVSFQRIAILETSVVFLNALFLLVWIRAIRSNSYFLCVLSGVILAANYQTKSTQLFFVLVGIIASLLIDKPWRDKLRITGFLIVGFLLTMSLWFTLIFWPHRDLISQYQLFYMSQHGQTPLHFLGNITTQPFFFYFNRTPLIFISAWSFLIWGIFDFKGIRSQPITFFCYLWFVAGLIFLAPMGYRPLRYYMPLLPPMIFLAFQWLHYLMNSQYIFQERKRKIFTIVLSAWMLVPLVVNLIPLFDHFIFADKFFGLFELPGYSKTGVFLVGIVSFLMIFVVVKFLEKRRRIIPVLIIFFFTFHIYQIGSIYANRSYSILETSRDLQKRLPPDAVIGGQWAPELCLETNFRSIPIWKNFVNWKQPFRKHEITHLLSWEYPLGDELQLQKNWFPMVMKNAVHIKVYKIKGTPVHLWRTPDVTLNSFYSTKVTVPPNH